MFYTPNHLNLSTKVLKLLIFVVNDVLQYLWYIVRDGIFFYQVSIIQGLRIRDEVVADFILTKNSFIIWNVS